MSLIYWESMLFIYYFEGHPEYEPRVSGVLRHMEARGDSLCTSAFTAAEVLAGLHRGGSVALGDGRRVVLSIA